MKTIDPTFGKYDADDGFGSLKGGRTYGHTGIDAGLPAGTDVPIYAAGVVVAVGFSEGNGYYLAWKIDGTNLYTAYIHGEELPNASVGDVLELGETGRFLSGNTGTNSRGAHLHVTLSGSNKPYLGYGPLQDPWVFIQDNLLANALQIPTKDGVIMAARAIRNDGSGEIRAYSDQVVGNPQNWVYVRDRPNWPAVLEKFYGIKVLNANATDFDTIRLIATGTPA